MTNVLTLEELKEIETETKTIKAEIKRHQAIFPKDHPYQAKMVNHLARIARIEREIRERRHE